MKKAVKIGLGILGGYMSLNIMAMLTAYACGEQLKNRLPHEADSIANKIDEQNRDPLLGLLSLGIRHWE